MSALCDFLSPPVRSRTNSRPFPAKVQPVARTESQSRFPNTVSHVLVISKIAQFEPNDARLDSSPRYRVQLSQPCSKRNMPAVVNVLANDEYHHGFSTVYGTFVNDATRSS